MNSRSGCSSSSASFGSPTSRSFRFKSAAIAALSMRPTSASISRSNACASSTTSTGSRPRSVTSLSAWHMRAISSGRPSLARPCPPNARMVFNSVLSGGPCSTSNHTANTRSPHWAIAWRTTVVLPTPDSPVSTITGEASSSPRWSWASTMLAGPEAKKLSVPFDWKKASSAFKGSRLENVRVGRCPEGRTGRRASRPRYRQGPVGDSARKRFRPPPLAVRPAAPGPGASACRIVASMRSDPEKSAAPPDSAWRLAVVGTAGHIDHGKTALVRRLTGVDTDRLPEEKRRGISIDLGFAPLVTPAGVRLGIVDVPGHERFVKNMLAGVGGVDLVLLVIAADEGVMPQTREHLAIVKLLGVQRGVIVLTKRDLVDGEWLTMVTRDVRALVAGTFLADAPIVPFSAVSGDGSSELLAAMDAQLATLD